MVKQTVRAQYFKKLVEATFSQIDELTYTRANLPTLNSYYICRARVRVGRALLLSKTSCAMFIASIEGEAKADAANKSGRVQIVLHKAAADCVVGAEASSPTNGVGTSSAEINVAGNVYTEAFDTKNTETQTITSAAGEYLYIAFWQGVYNSTGIQANVTGYIRNVKASAVILPA